MNNAPEADQMVIHSDKKSKIQKKGISTIFLSAILIITMLSIIVIYQMYNLKNANRWVAHTYKVILAAQNSLYYLTFVESEQRKYLLFNDKSYFTYVDNNISKMNQSLTALINLTIDNADEHERSIRLSELMNKKLNILAQMVQFKIEAKLSSPAAIDLRDKNQVISQEIQLLTNEIIQVEFSLLYQRNNNAINNATVADAIFISGQIISIIFLLIAFLLLNRELLKRWHGEMKIQRIESQLRSIIEGASDMIAALDLNYRFIIFNHAYKTEFQRIFNTKIYPGMSLDEALSHLPEIKNKLKKSWQQSLEGDEYVQNIEFDINNQKEIYEITSSLIKDQNDHILGAVHIDRNITERIRNELALSEGMYELKDKNEKITLLLDMSDVMLACDSIKELSEIIAKYCYKILSFSKGVFYIMHPSKDILEAGAAWGGPVANVNHFAQDQCWALRLGHIYHVGSHDAALMCHHVVNYAKDQLSYLCVPLRAKNDIYGLLYLEIVKNQGEQQLTNNERLIVNAFAELAALALANVRLREILSYQSVRDPLTSLYNRRYLEEFLLKQIYQSERSKRPLSILMLDLDHFKAVNDLNGHDAGDLVLKELAEVLMLEIRPGDLAARYGGEEFIIVFYDTSGKTALKRAEHIRKSISLLHVKFGAQEMGKITASIGVSEYPRDGRNNQELIEAADKALYVAKNNGRNKVVLFSEIGEFATTLCDFSREQ